MTRARAATPLTFPMELAALREEVRELREALAARDDFIATAAHDLRNPMAGIVLSVTNMLFLARKQEGLPPWVLPRLEALDRQSRHFVRRATSLLDATRLASGRTAIHPEPMDLGVLVREVVLELSPDAERAGCTLDLSIEAGVVGLWDRASVESIVINLLSNAIKYGAGAPVELCVRTVGRDAVLTVRDEGIGIAPEDRARIFDRFERARLRADRSGFGVGLWIARQLAVAHGGDITVDSVPGRESVFTVNLPRETPAPHA
jgi:signal transduction histidine kinase